MRMRMEKRLHGKGTDQKNKKEKTNLGEIDKSILLEQISVNLQMYERVSEKRAPNLRVLRP